MGHAGASDGLYQSLLDNAFLNVEGKLAGTLLRCTPAYAMRKTGNVFHSLCLYPLCFFRDGSTAVMYALCHGTHFFNFL
jgi:hypothetical protein